MIICWLFLPWFREGGQEGGYSTIVILNLRSPCDYVGSSIPPFFRSFVRACGSVLDRKLLERLMSPSPKSQVMFASAFS